MSSDRHKTQKKLLERMIETLTEELNIPAKSSGRQVDLATDPPPDLIIEVDISRPASQRIAIYQQLGVPEIWRYAGGSVQIYRRQDGEYIPCDLSPAFPLVSTAMVNQFLRQAETQDDTTFIRTWRRWIQQQVSSAPA